MGGSRWSRGALPSCPSLLLGSVSRRRGHENGRATRHKYDSSLRSHHICPTKSPSWRKRIESSQNREVMGKGCRCGKVQRNGAILTINYNPRTFCYLPPRKCGHRLSWLFNRIIELYFMWKPPLPSEVWLHALQWVQPSPRSIWERFHHLTKKPCLLSCHPSIRSTSKCPQMYFLPLWSCPIDRYMESHNVWPSATGGFRLA